MSTLNETVQAFWPVIAGILGSLMAISITWWRISIKFATKQALDDERAKELELRMTKMETKVEAIFPDINTIKTDVAVMKNTLEYIKGSITQLSSSSLNTQK